MQKGQFWTSGIINIVITCLTKYNFAQANNSAKEIVDSVAAEKRHGLTEGDIVVDVSSNGGHSTDNIYVSHFRHTDDNIPLHNTADDI